MTKAQQKFVVWDWNGTLLDDTDAVLVCINSGLSKIACAPLTLDFFRDIQVRSRNEFYLAAHVPEAKLAELLAFERSLFHDNYEPLADQAPLRVGASDLLHNVKANKISNIILSNHITDQIVRLLERHVLADCFDDVMGYASREIQFLDMTKGERLRRYIEAKNLDASNALIIGDTVEEIEIARELGMGCIAITGGVNSESRLREKSPDHIIHSLQELKPILQERGFMS